MRRQTIKVGTFEVNCSILVDGETAYLVDPGAEAERIVGVLADLALAPAAILLTHAHFDHIGAIPALQQRFPGLPVVVSAADREVITHPMNQYPPDYPPIELPKNLKSAIDGFQIIETPGHTPGGVCYYLPDDRLLLSGDTLFCGSFGRTDLPGGDYDTLVGSLAKLARLPPDTLVVPGHGPETTIARELGEGGVLHELVRFLQ